MSSDPAVTHSRHCLWTAGLVGAAPQEKGLSSPGLVPQPPDSVMCLERGCRALGEESHGCHYPTQSDAEGGSTALWSPKS